MSMVVLHPQFIRAGDKDQFVVLPHEEFVAVCELLEDLIDLRLIDQAHAENQGHPGIPLQQLKAELGIE